MSSWRGLYLSNIDCYMFITLIWYLTRKSDQKKNNNSREMTIWKNSTQVSKFLDQEFFFKSIYLTRQNDQQRGTEKKEEEERERASICWFASQMGQSQESGAPLGSPTWWQGPSSRLCCHPGTPASVASDNLTLCTTVPILCFDLLSLSLNYPCLVSTCGINKMPQTCHSTSEKLRPQILPISHSEV